MQENNENEMKRRGYLKGVGATGLATGGLIATTGRSLADSSESQDVNGDDVYLVFGADAASDGLENWVERHKEEIHTASQQSSTQVIQYQDVTQININQETAATAIAIDGGTAEAVQQTEQENTNTQEGSAQSINVEQETCNQTFTDLQDVYIVFAEESDHREFSGWVVSDDTYQTEQSATGTITQVQEVDQLNFNSQSAAIAIAEEGSTSHAHHESFQNNANFQVADATAANIGDSNSQEAETSVEQLQDVGQININEEGIATAIAVGPDSVAEAVQSTYQFNLNEQFADATAINFDPKSIEEVAASAGMTGDISNDALARTEAGSSQSNTQAATAEITQVQSVGQENINFENAAIAVAIDRSQATAHQGTYQTNFNAQVASATAVNVEDACYRAHAVVNGADPNGDETWAIVYENGDGQTEQQVTEVDITQVQIVEQLNVSEELAAIAVATNCSEAVAEQLNYQVNQNVQLTDAS